MENVSYAPIDWMRNHTGDRMIDLPVIALKLFLGGKLTQWGLGKVSRFQKWPELAAAATGAIASVGELVDKIATRDTVARPNGTGLVWAKSHEAGLTPFLRAIQGFGFGMGLLYLVRNRKPLRFASFAPLLLSLPTIVSWLATVQTSFINDPRERSLGIWMGMRRNPIFNMGDLCGCRAFCNRD